MKSQDYEKIFKEGREKISTAQKEGTFSLGDHAPKIVSVSDSEIEKWQSAQGSEISARLTQIEGDKIYVFETAKGQTIRAEAKNLSPESVKRARKLAGLE